MIEYQYLDENLVMFRGDKKELNALHSDCGNAARMVEDDNKAVLYLLIEYFEQFRDELYLRHNFTLKAVPQFSIDHLNVKQLLVFIEMCNGTLRNGQCVDLWEHVSEWKEKAISKLQIKS